MAYTGAKAVQWLNSTRPGCSGAASLLRVAVGAAGADGPS